MDMQGMHRDIVLNLTIKENKEYQKWLKEINSQNEVQETSSKQQ